MKKRIKSKTITTNEEKKKALKNNASETITTNEEKKKSFEK